MGSWGNHSCGVGLFDGGGLIESLRNFHTSFIIAVLNGSFLSKTLFIFLFLIDYQKQKSGSV